MKVWGIGVEVIRPLHKTLILMPELNQGSCAAQKGVTFIRHKWVRAFS